MVGVSLLALLLAGAITWHLRRRIVQPLAAAATVADRIARGELQTPIPEGDGDETGALLNSMTVMQDNIRQMMARETAMRRSAESRLSDALETSNEGVMLVAPDGHIALAIPPCANSCPNWPICWCRHASDAALAGESRPSWRRDRCRRSTPSGHAELAAGLRPLAAYLTGSATSEGGTIIFFSTSPSSRSARKACSFAKQEAESRQRRQDPLPGQYEP